MEAENTVSPFGVACTQISFVTDIHVCALQEILDQLERFLCTKHSLLVPRALHRSNLTRVMGKSTSVLDVASNVLAGVASMII